MFGLYLLVALVTQFAPEDKLVEISQVEIEKQVVQVSLSNVNGIKSGTPVTYKGQLIGTVLNIKENRIYNKSINSNKLTNNYSVEVSFNNKGIQLTSNTIALVVNRLASNSIEENKVIELLDSRNTSKTKPTNTKYIKGYSSYREFWMSKDV
ncbi:MAG: MCE family protein [Deltaproteobacteria bacterium]|jgi:hypothetical protein|nr:MCE family protein [Deltaproteobacteria bacterium]